jgi:hypothetical protein
VIGYQPVFGMAAMPGEFPLSSHFRRKPLATLRGSVASVGRYKCHGGMGSQTRLRQTFTRAGTTGIQFRYRFQNQGMCANAGGAASEILGGRSARLPAPTDASSFAQG